MGEGEAKHSGEGLRVRASGERASKQQEIVVAAPNPTAVNDDGFGTPRLDEVLTYRKVAIAVVAIVFGAVIWWVMRRGGKQSIE